MWYCLVFVNESSGVLCYLDYKRKGFKLDLIKKKKNTACLNKAQETETYKHSINQLVLFKM